MNGLFIYLNARSSFIKENMSLTKIESGADAIKTSGLLNPKKL